MSERIHIVRQGDTLRGISRHYDVDMALLAEFNDLHGHRQHALQIGQQIRLPDAAQAEADTQLSLRILDLAFRPINRAKLKLEFDGEVHEVVGDSQGEIGPIAVDDHAKGLKVYFRELDGEYVLIADHKALPLGRKRLTLTSRKMLVRGNYLHQAGSQRQTTGDARRDVARNNSGRHIEPAQANSSAGTVAPRKPPGMPSGAGGAPAKATSSAPPITNSPGLLDRMSDLASDAWGWLTMQDEQKTSTRSAPSAGTSKPPANQPLLPAPMSRQTRVEGGQPTHVVGALFTAENLKLQPANEKYRKIIIDIAKRHGMSPQTLAAVINAEAAKDYKTGEWKADSKASTSSASGLTQFLDDTFLELATDKRSMVNQMLKRTRGYEQVNAAYHTNTKGERVFDYIYGQTGDRKHRIDEDDVLPLRFDAEYSIDAGAVYARKNLDTMSRLGVDSSGLPPEDLAKLMYMAHHEGAGGAVKVIKGTLTEDRAKVLLPAQVPGEKKRKALLERFDGNYKRAYIHWLYSYTDSMINVLDFMVKPSGYQPRSMSAIAATVNGEAPTAPSPKTAPRSAPNPSAKPAPAQIAAPATKPAALAVLAPATGTPKGAVAAPGWRNPMDVNTIRSARLASWKGATFGMVRSNGTRAHQGIDLVAMPGTAVFAVASGKVVSVYRGFQDRAGFGATVVLCVDVNDLPEAQRNYYLGKRPNAKVVYFAYCHLSRIDVSLGKHGSLDVEIGTKLGETGESGNAHGMNTVALGAHLHFEVRYQHPLPAGRTGLNYRVDPRPFLMGVPDPA